MLNKPVHGEYSIIKSDRNEMIRSHLVITSIQQCILLLVQNSLQANASKIQITMQNKPTIISVQDDGHGIKTSDFHLIGRRFCTLMKSSLLRSCRFKPY